MHLNLLGGDMTRAEDRISVQSLRCEQPPCVSIVVDQNYCVRQAAEAVNVSSTSMDKGARQLREERNGTSSMPNALTPDQRKTQELEKRIKRLEMEKERLKKATLFFAKETR